MNKEYIFVTGPSESGKSGTTEYMENYFDDVKHLKMRDIIKMASSAFEDNTEQFWNDYINMHILYIDANLKNRVIREYAKLMKEGKNISLEEVLERTYKKDKEKEKFGLQKIKTLVKDNVGIVKMQGEGNLYPTIIDNNGSLDELHRKLEEYINNIKIKNKEDIER